MIHDATVEVTCDSAGCHESVVLNPEYVYRTMNENSGYYDTSDKALHRLLQAEDWTVVGERTYCEGCSDDEEHDDED
jgi:hypothetical protein